MVDGRIANDVRLIAAALPVRASVSLTNQGTMKVSVNRVTQDLSATAPGPAYPVKIGISADGASLTLGDAGGPYSVTNPGPFQVTAYPTNGGAPTTYILEYPASATPPPTANGMTYEIWDGNSRIQFSINGTATAGRYLFARHERCEYGGQDWCIRQWQHAAAGQIADPEYG